MAGMHTKNETVTTAVAKHFSMSMKELMDNCLHRTTIKDDKIPLGVYIANKLKDFWDCNKPIATCSTPNPVTAIHAGYQLQHGKPFILGVCLML